jgi:fibronectin type 3 domain-containing protein
MKFCIRYFLIVAGVIVLSHAAVAQHQQAKIHVIARPSPDKIMLRWGPDNEIAWQYLVKQGVTLERYTISRNGNVVNTAPEKIQLGGGPIKPWPASAWQPRIESNDYFAIAAQAIYGEDFAITNQNKGNVIEMMNLSKQIELRFSFLLFAADQSFEVAQAAGLGFEDKTVKPGEKYLYRVFPSRALPVKIDTGFVYVGTNDVYELPPPLDLKADFTDGAVTLSWNKLYHERIYNSYIIEKSDDEGKTFKATKNLPFVMTEPERSSASPLMFRSDSLAQNNKVFAYRVRGITSFGELGPPSEIVSGMGIDRSSFQIVIKKSSVVNNREVNIEWSLEPKESIKDVTTFEVLKSTAASGTYQSVKDKISPDKLSLMDPSPGPTNYYMVSANTKAGQRINSFPVLVQLVDSIPPVQPIGLTGMVDSIGIVRLNWKANTENDLIGYRIYRANYSSSEFSQITHTHLKGIRYADTISLKSLDKNMYYKITALDNRFNESTFSTVLTLRKPDIIAPVPPVFVNFSNTKEGIKLEWKKSSSNDISVHTLYRKEGRGDWQLLKSMNVDSLSFLDKRIQPSVVYRYKVIAVDSAGNQSAVAKEILVKSLAENDHLVVSTLTAAPDRALMKIVLGWQYPQWNNIQKFFIYRGSDGEPLTLYKSLPASSRGFSDAQVKIASSYQYRIKVIFTDGTETAFSEKVEVKF